VIQVGSVSEQQTPDHQRSMSQKYTQQFQQSQRNLLLAKSHELLENKEGAVQFYKEALKANCENYEAFNRLMTNFLIT